MSQNGGAHTGSGAPAEDRRAPVSRRRFAASELSRTGTVQRRGLRRRILLWFLILSLVPLLVSNTVGYLVTRRIIENQVRSRLRALVEAEAAHVAAEVERNQLLLERVVLGSGQFAATVERAAETSAPDRAARARLELDRVLQQRLMDLRPLSDLLVIDPGGQVLAATRAELVGADWAGTDLYRVGRYDRFFASDWDTRAGIAGPVYRLGAPITNPEGRSVGILAATVGLGHTGEFLTISPHLTGDIRAYVVDDEGRPVLASGVGAWVDQSQPLVSPLIQRSGTEAATDRYETGDGTEVLGSAVSVRGLPWRFVAEMSVAEAFGPLRSLALLALALEAAFALVLVAVVWIVARSIVAPLRRLVAAAERIRDGELGVKVGINRSDELGELGRTFDLMSHELSTSAERLRSLHEQELRRAAQLASVGELASGIAHEMKNPIVGLATGLDLLAAQRSRDGPSDSLLSQMREQLHRLESAIRDLLSYARPKQPMLTSADPGELVERAIALVRPQADAAGVTIETRASGGASRLPADPELMTQALVNLALNGVQAMGPGGRLTVTTVSGNGTIRIEITDTGPGVPMDQLEFIFRPFYTTKHRGTGLGLSISRGIVERHGGRLEVASSVGEGTTFSLIFPSDRMDPESAR